MGTLVVTSSSDYYDGIAAKFKVLVNGVQVGTTYTATAKHGSGWTNTTITGDFSQASKVEVVFINDANGTTGDRNLWVDKITLDGKVYQTEDHDVVRGSTVYTDRESIFWNNAKAVFDIPTATDTLVVTTSSDYYDGVAAKFNVLVDGVQVGGTYTATAKHGSGWTNTTITGNFAGADRVEVVFINDANGSTGDRNLWVDKISLNGTVYQTEDHEVVRGSTVYTDRESIFWNNAKAVFDLDGNDTPTSGSLPDSAFDLFAFMGQSNATGHFFKRSGDTTTGPYGNDVFEQQLGAALGGTVKAINAGVSGSGSNQYADGSLYWWNLSTNQPSQLLKDAIATIKSAEGSSKELDGIIWAQGEDDARKAYGTQEDLFVDRYVAATEKVFAYIRQQLGDPDLPIFIQELGDHDNMPDAGLLAIRKAQMDIIARDPYTYLGAKTVDIVGHNTDSIADDIHFTQREYGMIADRLADTVADILIA